MAASKFQAIYKGRDFYAPAFDIRIQGQELPKETRGDVIDVKYVDSVDQIDTFEITLNNWDAGPQDFKYTGSRKGGRDAPGRHRLFEPGQVIELWMGYFKPTDAGQRDSNKPEPLRLMLAGTINRLAPNFPSSGQPTLKVSGQSVLAKLITRQETHAYGPDVRASQIAKRVADRGGLKLNNLQVPLRTDPSAAGREPVIEHLLQDNQYDILFLLQLAHWHGYDVLLKDEGKEGAPQPYLFFGPSSHEPPAAYAVEWGRSLIQFQPTLTTSRQVNEVTVRGWNAMAKRPIRETVNRSQLSTRPLRDGATLQRLEEGFKERQEIIVDKPFRNEQEARRYAMDRLDRLSRDLVSGRGATLGTPDLRAGSRLDIRALGSTFDGEYFVKSTTHTIGAGGYTTEFEARMEERD
jgi:uncharacterized protein